MDTNSKQSPQDQDFPFILTPSGLSNFRAALQRFAPPCVANHAQLRVPIAQTAYAIAHGLKDSFGNPLTPNFVSVSAYPVVDAGGVAGVYISQTTAPDEKNIYVANDQSTGTGITATWYAAFVT